MHLANIKVETSPDRLSRSVIFGTIVERVSTVQDMKVTFRTVTGSSFSLDLDDKSKVTHQRLAIRSCDATKHHVNMLRLTLRLQVSDVKAKVQQEKGDGFPAAHQVLIFQGKVGQLPQQSTSMLCSIRKHVEVNGAYCQQVLKDETTLEENKVSENGFMVVMVTKVECLRS